MDIHPVALRALKWKLGEVTLTKEEEARLAADFTNMVTDKILEQGSGGPWERAGGSLILKPAVAASRTTSRPKTTVVSALADKEPPKTTIARVVSILSGTKRSLTPGSVYQYFRRQHWGGSEGTIRKVMYRGVRDKVLKRVGGVYAVR